MEQHDILNWIPQRPPFVLVDQLVLAEVEKSVTLFKIPEDHVLVERGVLTEAGMVENMAQTAAAGMGYIAAQSSDGPAPVGYIGALKNLKIGACPPIGTIIKTEVLYLQQVFGARLVAAKILWDDKEIASCEFKIFIQTESNSE